MKVKYRLGADDYRALVSYLYQDERQNPPRQQSGIFLLEVVFIIGLLVINVALLITLGYSIASGLFASFGLAAWFAFGSLLAIINAVLFVLLRDVSGGLRRHVRIWRPAIDDEVERMQKVKAIDPAREVRAVIGPDGLTEITESCLHHGLVSIATTVTSRAPWKVIDVIDIAAEHAFFKVGDAGWLILPRRAFPMENDFFHFIATAKKYRDNTEGGLEFTL